MIGMQDNSRRGHPLVYCIGDSHASLFSGQEAIQPLWPKPSNDVIPYFKTFHIGPVLAHALAQYGTRAKGREILSILLARQTEASDRAIPDGSLVLLCFGEIDCRCHIIPQSKDFGGSLEDAAYRAADRYCRAVTDVRAWGHQPLVWNVVPSSRRNEGGGGDYPMIGTSLERNEATRLFNSRVAGFCEENGIAFIDVFDALVEADGLPKMEYFMDDIHLSQRAMPLVIEWLRRHL